MNRIAIERAAEAILKHDAKELERRPKDRSHLVPMGWRRPPEDLRQYRGEMLFFHGENVFGVRLGPPEKRADGSSFRRVLRPYIGTVEELWGSPRPRNSQTSPSDPTGGLSEGQESLFHSPHGVRPRR